MASVGATGNWRVSLNDTVDQMHDVVVDMGLTDAGVGTDDILEIALAGHRRDREAGAIFAFRYHWLDYFHPLIYLNTRENFVISLGLQLLNSRYVTQVQQTMAMTLISVIPLIIVFFVAQDRYIQGITVTGVKG